MGIFFDEWGGNPPTKLFIGHKKAKKPPIGLKRLFCFDWLLKNVKPNKQGVLD